MTRPSPGCRWRWPAGPVSDRSRPHRRRQCRPLAGSQAAGLGHDRPRRRVGAHDAATGVRRDARWRLATTGSRSRRRTARGARRSRRVSRNRPPDPDRRHRQGNRRRHYARVIARPISRRRGRFTTGSSRTPFAIADVKGCGLGDIRGMLEMKNLSGKCADLNALFVGLSRAAGCRRAICTACASRRRRSSRAWAAPAATSPPRNIAAPRCGPTAYGWIPVDPADVRKLMLEEKKPTLAERCRTCAKARDTLFGSWEMNWIAFNDAHDVAAARIDRQSRCRS